MDYFLEFHWWYVVVGIILLFMLFGKSKGGVVVKQFTANLEVLDERFAGCRTEAKYTIFKEGKPKHIEIEVEKLSIPVDEELEFQLNGTTLAKVRVKRNKEAEFDHWSDEGVDFPVIKQGDTLVIKYKEVDVLRGIFS